MHKVLEWQDEPVAPPTLLDLKELTPEQTDSMANVDLEEVSMEKVVQVSSTVSGPSNDDFVNIEKEVDEKYSADPDVVIKRRKGNKKKN